MKEKPKNENNAENTEIENLPAKNTYPEQLGLIVVHYRPLFPSMIFPMVVENKVSRMALKHATEKTGNYVAFSLKFGEKDGISKKGICKIGVLAKVIRIIEENKKEVQVVFEVISRIKIKSFLQNNPFFLVLVQHIEPSPINNDDNIKVYSREILSNIRELIKIHPVIKEELGQVLSSKVSINDADRLADFTASILFSEKKEMQDILETLDVLERLKKVLFILKKELDLGRLQSKISKQIDSRLQKNQREFFLREQLKEIKKELGLAKDEKSGEIEKFITRAAKLNFSSDAKKTFDEEIEKLQLLDTHSPDFSLVRNYLDWIVSLPWGVYSEEKSSVIEAEKILQEDHYGLDDIKERVLEFIAVSQLAKKDTSSILCFVGPPGVGKTSIGKSIAKALKRPFYRFSVGGMRDESEIKGHRRTYIGAMPGKFIQTLKQTKVSNPVIMLDEIDKLGNSYQGDPASALLEVFDSEQNNNFLDHYLDIPFDLSKVFFITTANQLDTIPSALLDRMEVLRLAGYITEEKLQIVKKYIIPKQRKNHGLKSTQLQFTDTAIRKIIEGYARESGVRNLEGLLRKICRKVAYEIAMKTITRASVNHQRVEKYLKLPIFTDDTIGDKDQVGLVNGLAWTSLGGDVLPIEAIPNKGKKGFKQTGQLGNVMVESSEIAYSYVFSNAENFQGKKEFFEENFIHLHVPAGATPKDGPSAGITMASTLISLMLKKPVNRSIGMTGELTLRGDILPIGGLKEKIIAAKRNGLKQVILPNSNKKDYTELPEHLKDLKVRFVKNYKEIFPVLFS